MAIDPRKRQRKLGRRAEKAKASICSWSRRRAPVWANVWRLPPTGPFSIAARRKACGRKDGVGMAEPAISQRRDRSRCLSGG